MSTSLFAVRPYLHLFGAQRVALAGNGLATIALGLLAFELAGTGQRQCWPPADYQDGRLCPDRPDSRDVRRPLQLNRPGSDGARAIHPKNSANPSPRPPSAPAEPTLRSSPPPTSTPKSDRRTQLCVAGSTRPTRPDPLAGHRRQAHRAAPGFTYFEYYSPTRLCNGRPDAREPSRRDLALSARLR